ncbi:Hypothetical predicted protein [Pelobates cultripes]|uniref:Uncharacterized protein n=1 Tax=Pelobates cultripes TaxID=61616 RepID=A0AAD1SG57_PELCU|nr:Hypothetical predicted protein [Pelobates cultripes]
MGEKEEKEKVRAEIPGKRSELCFTERKQQFLTEAKREKEKSQWKVKQCQWKLGNFYHISSFAVEQLYEQACHQQGLSLWPPLQAVYSLYKESVTAHQKCCELGVQFGYHQRNKELLAWVSQCQETIRREDLISVLCGKLPPAGNSNTAPHMIVGSSVPGTLSGSSAVLPDSVNPSTSGSGSTSNTSHWTNMKNGRYGGTLKTSPSEEKVPHVGNGKARKRTLEQSSYPIPTGKRTRSANYKGSKCHAT